MKGIKAPAILVLGLALIIAVVLPATAENQRSALFKQYSGTITSIRIDRCGTRPGLCEGTIILTQRQGAEVTLAIRPGTWIKRGWHTSCLGSGGSAWLPIRRRQQPGSVETAQQTSDDLNHLQHNSDVER
jgi:hypothetical protein